MNESESSASFIILQAFKHKKQRLSKSIAYSLNRFYYDPRSNNSLQTVYNTHP